MNGSTQKKSGGKAANLRELVSIGSPVKPFITLNAVEVRAAVVDNFIPQTVQVAVDAFRATVKTDKFAVRSSADGEDSDDLSWAGQFQSLLDVAGDDIGEAIITCGKAGESATVKAYAQHHDVNVGNLELIVQEMVKARCAGILYTKDPVTSTCVMIIEVVQGISEALNNGQVAPQQLLVDPGDCYTATADGAVDELLTSEEVRMLVEEAKKIRHHFGWEADIEWAIEVGTGKLFINQVRPITAQHASKNYSMARIKSVTITSVSCAAERLRLADLGCDVPHDVLTDQNIAEILTRHPTQMGFGLFTHCFAHGEGAIKRARNELGYDIGPELETGFFRLVAGQPRCSLVHDALTYRIKGIPLDGYQMLVNHYLARVSKDPTCANYPEDNLYDQDPSLEFLQGMFGADLGREYRAAYDRFFAGIRATEDSLERVCVERFIPQWNDTVTECRRKADLLVTVDELVGDYRAMCGMLRIWACPMFVKVARLGFYASVRLRKLLQSKYDAETAKRYLNTLMVTDPERSPGLKLDESLYQLRNGHITIDEVKDTFGHMSQHQLEISVPRYGDQPELLRSVAAQITESPLEKLKVRMEERGLLLEQLEQEWGELWLKLEREIRMTQTYMSLREVVKFNYLKGYDVVRRLAVMIEHVLRWEAGLIFHLDPIEVFQLPQNEAKLHAMAKERQASWKIEVYVPPVLFTSDLEAIGRQPATDVDGVLRGIGVTSQVHEGDVVVITDLNDEKSIALLKSGSVLVAVVTDPAWSPVFAALGKTGAAITEIGGTLSHTAQCMRDQGIAGVVNVPSATTILKTGMRVRVNGPAGIVEIL